MLEILFRPARPASGCLCNMLNSHRKVEPIQDMTRRTSARGLTKKAWAFCSVAQHRYRRSERCAEVTQDRVELLTLPIRLDRDAAEKLLLPLVITCASQHDLERSHLIGFDRFHMAAVDRDRDRLRRWRS